MIGDSNDETNFLCKLILTDTQVSRLHKTYAYNSWANIKFSKILLSKMIQSEGFSIPILVLF